MGFADSHDVMRLQHQTVIAFTFHCTFIFCFFFFRSVFRFEQDVL